eukprot:gene8652-10304_t
MAHQTTDPSNPHRWVTLYLPYIDATKSQAEGRRISKEKAVENPEIKEIIEVLKSDAFPLPSKIENKSYARDYMARGRLRVQLKKSDNTLINPDFPDRKSIFMFFASQIKQLDSRKNKKQKEAADANKGKSKASGSHSNSESGRRHEDKRRKNKKRR